MNRTTEFNLDIFKELEILSGCKLSYHLRRGGSRVALKALDKPQLASPLERLGLFLKDEYAACEDDEVLNGGWEEGEIL